MTIVRSVELKCFFKFRFEFSGALDLCRTTIRARRGGACPSRVNRNELLQAGGASPSPTNSILVRPLNSYLPCNTIPVFHSSPLRSGGFPQVFPQKSPFSTGFDPPCASSGGGVVVGVGVVLYLNLCWDAPVCHGMRPHRMHTKMARCNSQRATGFGIRFAIRPRRPARRSRQSRKRSCPRCVRRR